MANLVEVYISLPFAQNGNFYDAVELTISSKNECAPDLISSVSSTTRIYPDLEPNVWDFDISVAGNDHLQFGSLSTNDNFNLEIYVNANSGNLITFAVKIWYDLTQFEVSSCEKAGKNFVSVKFARAKIFWKKF